MAIPKKPIKRGRKKKASFPTGLFVVVLFVLAAGGGAAWYYFNMPSVEKAKQLMGAGQSREAVAMLVDLDNKNSDEARDVLAHYYWFGDGKGREPEKALDYAKRMSMAGNPAYSAIVGKHLYREDDSALNREAIPHLQAAANSGDSECAEMLGKIYLHGWGVMENRDKAIELLSFAADNDKPQACALLGRTLSLDGPSAVEMDSSGPKYLERAAASGDHAAQFIAAQTYYDIDESEKAYPIFASILEHNPAANFYLADMHYYGDGAEQDLEKAFNYANSIADSEDAKVKVLLGKMYFHGHGVENDEGRAYEFLKGQDEDLDAAAILAVMHIEGRGVRQELVSGIKLLTKAAEGGHPEAQRILGELHISGKYVAFDREKGLAWLEKAAEAGDEEAEILFARHTNRIRQSEERRQQTADFLSASAEQEKEIERLTQRKRELEMEQERAMQEALAKTRTERTKEMREADARRKAELASIQREIGDADENLRRKAAERKKTEEDARRREKSKFRSVYKDPKTGKSHRTGTH